MSNFGVQFRAAFFAILLKGESETVFTTCIYHIIGDEYKIPHIVNVTFFDLYRILY